MAERKRAGRRRFELSGSAHPALVGARVLGRLPPDTLLDVSLDLRRRGRPLPDLLSGRDLRLGPRLTRDELRARHGADPRDQRRLQLFAQGHGLTWVDFSRGRRTAVLRGPARALEAAFGVELLRHRHADGRSRHGHEGPLRLPSALEGVVRCVLGLQGRPAAKPHVQARRAKRGPVPPDVAHYTADQVARLYSFPPGLDGRGQSIGIVQLGGGFRRDDLRAYFRRLRLPVPRIEVKRINGARNRPVGRPMSADAEVLMDAEIAGAVAPGARLVIYFAPDDDRGFIDAVKAAVHDRAADLSVLTMSWGHPESEWSPAARTAMNDALHEAALLGITVCASAGDQGASCGLTGRLAVEFPAASPYALACGGTRLLAREGRVRGETVWNDLAEGFGATGGGISRAFPRPGYQRGAGVTRAAGRQGRGLPDVAGNADPETGYVVRVDGRWLRLGGTSAVAPLWAGLIARLNQGLGRRVGFVVPALYRLRGSGAFRAVTRGGNGGYTAGPGWNACAGLGTPRGAALLRALRRFVR